MPQQTNHVFDVCGFVCLLSSCVQQVTAADWESVGGVLYLLRSQNTRPYLSLFPLQQPLFMFCHLGRTDE